MIKKIFLHIGSHKTGTSSIQQFLKRNQKRLKNHQSIYYFNFKSRPFEFCRKDHMNQFLWFQVNRLEELQDIAEDYVIISNEDFSWINLEEDIKQLALKLYQYANEVEVIVYLRRQEALAISHKQQGAKGGQAMIAYGHEPQALPSEFSPYANAYLNFYEKINKWSKAFGEESITVRIFEKDNLYNGDAVEDFAQVVGIKNYDKLRPANHVNESIARIPQLFLHQIRKQQKKYFANGTQERNFLIAQMKKLSVATKDKLLPSKSEAIEFYEQFKESNQKLNKWLKLTDKEFLFDDDFSNYPDIGNGYELSSSDIIEIFHIAIQQGLNDYIKRKDTDEFQII